jgi:hypothetical protein
MAMTTSIRGAFENVKTRRGSCLLLELCLFVSSYLNYILGPIPFKENLITEKGEERHKTVGTVEDTQIQKYFLITQKE